MQSLNVMLYLSPLLYVALVSESYDCHPGFTLPQESYTLSLTKTPPQPKEFQALVDHLHTILKQNSSQSINAHINYM